MWGGILPKICLVGSPLQEGRVSLRFRAKVHSSDAYNQRSTIYCSPGTICVRSLSMLTCWDGEGRLLSSQNTIWFCLIVLNERWHTHISSCHPMVVGWGSEVGGSEVNVLFIEVTSV